MKANSISELPLVSILIDNYNYGHFLAEAIDSALAQTYLNREVIVVDNGSTDHSREVMAQYGDKIVPVFQEQGGQSAAFNAGFAASRGEILCFLDADDAYLPEKVAEVVRVFVEHPERQWCFHMLQFVGSDLKTPVAGHYDDQDSGQVFDCDLRNHMRRGGVRGAMPFSIPATSGLCFTRNLLQQILPMPVAEGILLNDSYLQFSALALRKGAALAKKLSLQRLHDSNQFTAREFSNRKLEVSAKIYCLTAYSLRERLPFLSRFTNKYFAQGLSCFWQQNFDNKEISRMVENYFSTTSSIEKYSIYLRSFYYYTKSRYKSSL